MGTIATTASDVFRDYVTDGVAGSGKNKPNKADIRALFAALDAIVGERPKTISALKAIDTGISTRAVLELAGRDGGFIFTPGDFSTEVAADTAEGIYVEADDTPANEGAWIRVFSGPWNAAWFGFLPSATEAANVSAFNAMMTLAALDHTSIVVDDGAYGLNARIIKTTGKKLSITFGPNAVLTWSNASGGMAFTYTDELHPVDLFYPNFRTSYAGGGTPIDITAPSGSAYVPVGGPRVIDPIYRGTDTTTNYWTNGVRFENCWYPEIRAPDAQGKAGTFDMATGVIFTNCQAPIFSEPVFYHLATAIVMNGGTLGEGISFAGGEMVGVQDGINMNLGAFKPGISLHDMHINASRYPVILTNVGQVVVHDMSLYKTNGSSENWIGVKMSGCYGARVHDILGAHSGVTAGTGVLVKMENCDSCQVHDLLGEEWYGSGSLVEVGDGCGDNLIGNLQVGRNASGLVPVTFSGTPEKTNRFYGIEKVDRTAFTSGDTTPSVGNAITGEFSTANSSATTITTFDDGYEGQRIVVLINDGNTRLAHGPTLILREATGTVSPASGRIMQFRYETSGPRWREEFRSF